MILNQSEPSDYTPKKYKLTVAKTLLVQAHILAIEADDLIEFVAAQVHTMLTCPPNVNIGDEKRVWVLRGFYPDSTLFLKLSLVETEDVLLAKASPLLVKVGVVHNQREHLVRLDGNAVDSRAVDSMENTFFGADHKLDPIVKKISMPRCMSPKGMKLLKMRRKK